jgi:hypothetical protein
MPLPRLTQKLVASGKPLTPGWSLLEFQNIRDNPTKDLYFWEFQAVTGPQSSDENAQRTVTLMISGKALESGVSEVCNAYTGILCGLLQMTEEQLVEKDIDPALFNQILAGKRVWVDVQFTVSEGKSYPSFKQFSPATEIPF